MATKIPKGYHKMPDGKIMKDSAHKMKKGGSTPALPKAQSGGLHAFAALQAKKKKTKVVSKKKN